MATKDELKEKFSTGKKPTGADFALLIDESVQDLSMFYTKGEVDTELNKKANASSLAGKVDKSVVDTLIARIEALENV